MVETKEEILFLKDCLGASLETLAMPCMLLQRNTGDLVRGLIVIDSFDSVDKSGCIDYKSLQEFTRYIYIYHRTIYIFYLLGKIRHDSIGSR